MTTYAFIHSLSETPPIFKKKRRRSVPFGWPFFFSCATCSSLRGSFNYKTFSSRYLVVLPLSTEFFQSFLIFFGLADILSLVISSVLPIRGNFSLGLSLALFGYLSTTSCFVLPYFAFVLSQLRPSYSHLDLNTSAQRRRRSSSSSVQEKSAFEAAMLKTRENKPLYECFVNCYSAPNPLRPKILCDPLTCVYNDLFRFWAVSVHTRPEYFSCRRSKLAGVV